MTARPPAHQTSAATPHTEGQQPTAPVVSAPRRHRADVDVLRLLACITVMLGHSGGTLIRRTRDDAPDSAALTIGHLAEAINPWAVPMFFAIAGWAVLAGAPPRDQQSMIRRITRHLVPLLVWSVVFLVVYKLVAWDDTDFRGILATIPFESQQPSYHLWYLYVYIPLITVFGALMLFLRGQRPWFLMALALVFSGGGVALTFVQDQLDVEFASWAWGVGTYSVSYFVAGAILIHFAPTFRNTGWMRAGLTAVFLAAAVGVHLWETRVHYPIENANPLTPVLGGALIVLVCSFRVSDRVAQILKRIAAASFGAFLVHIMFVDLVFGRLFPLDIGLAAGIPLFVAGWIACIAVSFALSLTWGRIPGARRLLG